MAEVEEKQTEAEAVAEDKPEKKSKKSRKATKGDDGDEEKPKRSRPRNMDYPKIHDMITEALDVLDERKGVSLPAIKSYLEDNYHVDKTKGAVFVRKVLKAAIESGEIIRTRGTGLTGRFKVKHTKPTMIKKRRAPEDYQQIPYVTRVYKPRTPAKQKATGSSRKVTPAAKKAKAGPAKKGRPGRKSK